MLNDASQSASFHADSIQPFTPHSFVMKNRTPFHPVALPAIILLYATTLPHLPAQDTPVATPSVAHAEPGIEDVIDSLATAAENFVGAFNNRDAAAIAALFTPLGELVVSEGETLGGRQAIEDFYRDLFAGDPIPRMALEASDVELIAPGVAIEQGRVHLTLADDEPLRSIEYDVTHVRQADGRWLMAASRSLSEVTLPSERIKPLHWMIGEWTLESQDGVRIDMVIDLDERENFLLGEALVTDTEGDSQSINLRIGWNPATSSVYWWTFDSDGGNASGPWARRGDEWVISNTGITADAEASASSQTLVRDGDTMVWIATQRMLAGEARPDLIYRFVRRAPDPLSLLSPEAAGEPGEAEPASATDGQ
jgi:uncharacterized protein (TIGR02246 family)